jgi:polar amino acid transport system permease protein
VSLDPSSERRSKLLRFQRRNIFISTGSTIAFFAVLALIFVFAPGFKKVREDFLSWQAMKESFFGVINHGDPSIWRAFLVNVKMFVIAEPLILSLALLIALVRQIPGPVFFPLRMVAIAFTDFFRGIPLLLVIYITGFGIPGLEIHGLSYYRSPVVYGVIALVLSYSAYVAEVYRAGIESVHPSQVAAARSLGLSRWKALRFVVVPQAIRRVIPPLLNDFISLQKDTALVAGLGTIEAARAAQIYGADRFNFSSFLVAAALWILITIPLARFTDHLLERQRQRRSAGVLI